MPAWEKPDQFLRDPLQGGKWQIVRDVPINEFSRAKIDASVNELKEEKSPVGVFDQVNLRGEPPGQGVVWPEGGLRRMACR